MQISGLIGKICQIFGKSKKILLKSKQVSLDKSPGRVRRSCQSGPSLWIPDNWISTLLSTNIRHYPNALWVKLCWKVVIGEFTRMFPSGPIFMNLNYFRQNIWRLSSVQFHFWFVLWGLVEHSPLQKKNLQWNQFQFKQVAGRVWMIFWGPVEYNS